jgi:endogenous inhibitor of DNA gyrase (YacG/DUF329 family)
MTSDPVVPIAGKRRACPICGKPSAPSHRPFCSARCAALDLGRWLKGGYRVETEEAAEDASGEAREE